MARLASPAPPDKSSYEVVVIGSGYAGSVAASRLARAGREVVVLEQGREWAAGEFPSCEKEYVEQYQMEFGDRHLGPYDGLYGLNANRDLNVLYGVGLGGGSLINASIALRADPRVFQDRRWPQPIRAAAAAGGEFGRLDRWYSLAERMLRVNPYPEGAPGFPVLNKTQGLRRSAELLGEKFGFAPIAVNFDRFPDDRNHAGVEQTPCILCGDCFSGCNHTAKNTLDRNYIPDARNHGASFHTGITVRYVRRGESGGWRVVWQPTGRPDAAQERILEARHLILGAGTLGTNELLQRSRGRGLSLSDRLGEGFSGNADLLGLSYDADMLINGLGFGDRSPEGRKPVGPAVSGMIDLRSGRPLDDGRVLEEGSLSGATRHLYAAMLAAGAAALGEDTDRGLRDWLREKWWTLISFFGSKRGAVERTQVHLAIGHDGSDGRLVVEDDRLRIRWPGVRESHAIAANIDLVRQATAALGATYIPLPRLLRGLPPTLVSGHPTGGAAMADDAADGVANHAGQVFRGTTGTEIHAGLYVLDGALVPRSVGVNPFLTITALAERAVSLMADEQGWEIDYEE